LIKYLFFHGSTGYALAFKATHAVQLSAGAVSAIALAKLAVEKSRVLVNTHPLTLSRFCLHQMTLMDVTEPKGGFHPVELSPGHIQI